jgi:hypothetical protein
MAQSGPSFGAAGQPPRLRVALMHEECRYAHGTGRTGGIGPVQGGGCGGHLAARNYGGKGERVSYVAAAGAGLAAAPRDARSLPGL